ncbi:hypothetical protein PIB30_016543 [Stylosanthes scabra]|uniref:BED-type domain-containing protein n=1 Tax=Stylosanthes scabra TaxID=79078 RepID=A0ABU6R7M3_9FABA|nr:hypothetical protein [Stylosanthes scabra]
MASNDDNGGNNIGAETIGGGASKKIAKNAPGNRSDKAWKHGISVDGDAKKIKCKYCDKVVTEKTVDYSLEDLNSNEEWIVEDENEMESLEEVDTQIDINLPPKEMEVKMVAL